MSGFALSPSSPAPDESLSRMMKAALRRDDAAAVKEMLQAIAGALGAHGCALWQVRPEFLDGDGNPDRLPPDARLFVVADSYPQSVVCAYHDLRMSSATGTAILEGRVNIPDVRVDDRVDKTNPFVPKSGILSLCSVRIALDERTPGAITVYRCRVGGFTEYEIKLLEGLAEHVPILYQTIQDRL